jgi:hypothetical protein
MSEPIDIWLDPTIPGGAPTLNLSAIVPAGETWRIQNLFCADVATGDGRSGIFILEWGSAGTWEMVQAVALTGGSYLAMIEKDFVGNGTKRFRFSRENTSMGVRRMYANLKGFKAI